MGLFSGATYSDEHTRLDPGDVLVVYSDGVTEALNPASEEYGDARLADVTSAHLSEPLDQFLQTIITSVQTFANGASQSDDVTVLVLRYLGPPAADSAPA